MSWLDERIAAARNLANRYDALDTQAPNLYLDVWREISKIVDEANNKGFGLDRSGVGESRLVEVLRSDFGEAGGKIQITLAGKRRIEVNGSVALSFNVEICDDRVVCLKIDGRQISSSEAAIRIMDALLFPMLQRQ